MSREGGGRGGGGGVGGGGGREEEEGEGIGRCVASAPEIKRSRFPGRAVLCTTHIRSLEAVFFEGRDGQNNES